MPRPQTQSFEEMFGVGSVPIASYFGLPQGASTDTRFSPQARGMLAQGEEYAREQAAMDAERAAEELLGGAADMTDEDIQQQLLRSPKMFGTQAIQPLSGYMQFRQSTTPKSDEVLGPILREKITDPYHRERYQQRMLEEGLSANDAYDAYITDTYNSKFETALAEAGVPETEYAKLKTPSGKFIPAAVARAQQAAKTNAEEAKRALTRRTSDDPIDRKIDAYERAMEQREKIFKATGREDELAKDQTYLGYMAKLEEANKAKFAEVDPAPKIKTTTELPTPVAAPANSQIRPVAPEIAQRQQEQQTRDLERTEKTRQAQIVADTEWTTQKLKLEDRLRSAYKTPEELVGVAYEILSNTPVPVKTKVGVNEVDDLVPYRILVHRKLGLKPTEVAFKEPGNLRKGMLGLGIGTQEVTYDELLKEWAAQVVERFEAQQSRPQEPPAAQKPAGNIKGLQQVE